MNKRRSEGRVGGRETRERRKWNGEGSGGAGIKEESGEVEDENKPMGMCHERGEDGGGSIGARQSG